MRLRAAARRFNLSAYVRGAASGNANVTGRSVAGVFLGDGLEISMILTKQCGCRTAGGAQLTRQSHRVRTRWLLCMPALNFSASSSSLSERKTAIAGRR